MATQKQIKEWIPRAIQIFQAYIPLTGLPEIHIVSDKTLFKTRAELVEKLQSHQSHISPLHYNSVMEEIHGELGDAIIIQQEYVLSLAKDNRAEELFQHYKKSALLSDIFE